ncbi:MAG: hypothetical protein COY81_04730 [Candidatus Pacebacteria bacterium CG_4_10_14_0_8_um_filter_43_12]|nr:MAG: hypothetical protein COU66_01945 [Candidatus Pacebacteria bacterium CG10_big_fil_rev_8_21_14_0_10_44_11]PIY79038.1 MAG: hypothetical protein COY81_04730 [Candidatus Pacebacteria bacterium CG_4_10_14_0_8_um_filter_43_12]
MSENLIIRLLTLAFFLGLNVVLGSYFLLTVKGQSVLPTQVRETLSSYGVLPNLDAKLPLGYAPDYSLRIDLTSDAIIEVVNVERKTNKLSQLEVSDQLHQAAELILAEAKNNQATVTQEASNTFLAGALKKVGYSYSSTYQSVVIGPVTTASLLDYWLQHQQQESIFADEVSQIGVATTVKTDQGEFIGITVVLLAKPRETTTAVSVAKVETKSALPIIADQEVIDALNNYRQVHGVGVLTVHSALCAYAEKRVQDLVAYGGLDNHQGFQADFADPKNLPEQLKDYPGSKIGENLAHQFCKNMTTGDSFVAETGTAIIEWCFDSSTKGHREAQLSSDYHNVCVRHADGMYVVEFGE